MNAAEAVEAGDHARLAELIQSGDTSVATRDTFGQEPVHLAAEASDADALSALLACTAVRPDARDCSEPCVRMLLLRGVDPEARDVEGATALMYAAKAGHIAAARALIETAPPGAVDVDARDTVLWTALFYAAANKRADMCRLLQDKGASRDLRDGKGRTPAEVAREREFDMP